MAGMSVGAQTAKPLPSISREEALAALADGATLVSGNRRLARSLREAYHAARQEEGALAWIAPAVAPWEAWMGDLWNQAQTRSGRKPLLRLGADQELLLWERIVNDSAKDTLLSIEATAGVARDAWGLLQDWRLGHAVLRSPPTPDVAQFSQWADAFEAACDREGWIDAARATALLPELLDHVDAPQDLLLAGFDELTPVQESLLTALRKRGTTVLSLVPQPDRNRECLRYCLRTPRDEVRAAARWARELVDAGETGPIGVVVPDLAARQPEVERIFREVLDAPSLAAGGAATEGLFQISAGAPLSRYPLVRAALLALRLRPGGVDLATLSAWLRSEYAAGGEAERGARALLDRRLRDKGLPEVRLRSGIGSSDKAPRLSMALQSWLTLWGKLPHTAQPAFWAGAFAELLGALNPWDEKTLTGDEWQVLAEWNELLADFAALGATSGPLKLSHALQLLERMAAERMFQPDGEAGPVEVLGLLEASGAEFSHLWIAKLDDDTWPAEARPNPFLPFDLQRERGLPHASPERELAFARTRLENLIGGAERVVLSSAAADGDRELGPSPLMQHFSTMESAEPGHDGLFEAVREGAVVESFADPAGPPLGARELARGGSDILAHQAHCPFRAFAQLRLQAEPLPTAAPGLDALDRGTLVHALLECVWEELRGSAGLERADLPDVAGRGAQAALVRLSERRGVSLPDRFERIERRRLTELATEWLAIERDRQSPFRVVEAERRRAVTVGGLTLNVQIDRIDELEDGRHVLIDYKTGSPKPSEWDKERPLEPQVPLYAVTHPQPVAGALFAKLKPDAMGFKGAVEEDVNLATGARGDSGVLTADRLALWRRNLERLAEEFLHGAATVDPRDGMCGYCKIGSLCRVNELGGGADDEEEAGQE
jgi:ATP-dependent helicase/nuclease subunit B